MGIRRVVAVAGLLFETLRVPAAGRRTVRKRRTIFAMCAGAAFTMFLGLLALVRSKPELEADVVTTLRFQRRQHPILARIMETVSWLGFRPQSLAMPAAAITGALIAGFRRDAFFMACAWAASMVSYTTKRLVRRPRPFGGGIVVVDADLRDSSFPSGHVLHYVVFWGFFTYLWYTRLRGTWLRWGPVTLLTSMIAMVGPSRIYLGHHWLTDVLASYSLGTGMLLTLIGLRQRTNNDTGKG
jgi:undecaprenyl-diphosphatase